MNFGIASKVALVTGGSRGLGRAMVEALAREGCAVAFCARGQDGLEKAQAALEASGARILAYPADVTVPEQAEAFFNETVRRFGTVDIAVNNVGGGRGGATEEEQLRGALEVNLLTSQRICRLVVPLMRQRGWGRIINISSIWGRETGGGVSYNAGKAALISYTKALAHELASAGITVNSVAPGSILFPGGGWDRRADMAAQQGSTREAWIKEFTDANIPAGRFGTAEEVASVVAFLASEQASWVTGAIINVDGGQSRSGI